MIIRCKMCFWIDFWNREREREKRVWWWGDVGGW